MDDMTPAQMQAYAATAAEMAQWKTDRKRRGEQRDELIFKARAGGMAKAEIARRLGISRDTVIRVLGPDDESED
jgi:DNA invertase Pin-like site-specific DNA recombinase